MNCRRFRQYQRSYPRNPAVRDSAISYFRYRYSPILKMLCLNSIITSRGSLRKGLWSQTTQPKAQQGENNPSEGQ